MDAVQYFPLHFVWFAYVVILCGININTSINFVKESVLPHEKKKNLKNRKNSKSLGIWRHHLIDFMEYFRGPTKGPTYVGGITL